MNDFISRSVQTLTDLLPTDQESLRTEFAHNARPLLDAMVRKAGLVSREDFEAQRAMLARLRERVDALEEQLKSST